MPQTNAVKLGLLALGVAALGGCASDHPVPPPEEPAAIRAARMLSAELDRIAAEYATAVADGKVVDQPAYAKQLERLERAASHDDELGRFDVAAELEPLRTLIVSRAGADEVASAALAVGDRALDTHRVVLAPLAAPDRDRGRSLFRENCAKCHGDDGGGKGPEAAKLKIKPRSFRDTAVMTVMSPRRVFSTITDGIADAEMPQFDLLSVSDRWNLAFFVLTLRFVGPDGGEQGQLGASAEIPTLAELANARDVDLRTSLDSGAGDGGPALVFARTSLPFDADGGPLSVVNSALEAAISDHRAGRRAQATARIDAVLSESFAAFRPGLLIRTPALARRIERHLYQLREDIPAGASLSLEQQALAARADIDAANRAIGGIKPLALAGVAAAAALGWMIVILFGAAEASRAVGLARAAPAIHLGWGVAALAGLATLFTVDQTGELTSASGRHQAVAILRLLGAAGGLFAVGVLLRRMAIPIAAAPPPRGPIPWWLTGATFGVAYGGVLEASHHIGRIAVATGANRITLAIAGFATAGALAALLRLLVEAGRRTSMAAAFGGAAIVTVIASVGLAGTGVRMLIDGGTLSPGIIGVRRLEPLGTFPYRWSALAQVLVALIALGIIAVSLLAHRSAQKK